MKIIKPLTFIFTLLLIVSIFQQTNAQETTEQTTKNPTLRPFKIMQELGLTREQIQQIRRINQRRKPIVQAAQQRWRESNRNLDTAIYADIADETQIKELTKTAQIAQSELLKERTLTEFLIRKVLTPEQLTKFRDLRESMRNLAETNNLNKQNNQNDDQTPNRFQIRRKRIRPQ